MEIPGTDQNTIYYDIHCSTLAVKTMNTFLDPERRDAGIGALILSKKWADAEKVFDLMLDLKADCNSECMDAGTGWSHIMLGNGILMIFIFCNLGCIIVGRIRAIWRLMASYLGLLLCIGHIGILVSAGMFLFRK